jgi:hypothetical protein
MNGASIPGIESIEIFQHKLDENMGETREELHIP